MRKELMLFGFVLFISGTVLFGIMHLAISLYLPNLGGWSDPPGLIATVLSQIAGWFPYVLSLIFIVTGTIIIIYTLFNTR